MKASVLWFAWLPAYVLGQDPGLPVKNPTISYWQLPPNKDVSDHQSKHLPKEADIVIIGSGISGTSVAWHLLKEGNWTKDNVPKIAMLEARKACSGATGRNGGHIRPSSYSEYAEAKTEFSKSEAAKITKLRAAHIEALISAANQLPEDGRLAAEARTVDSVDAFFDDEQWSTAVEQLEVLKREVPELGKEFTQFNKTEAREISLLAETVGILTGTPQIAGAIWPYRFVTHALKMLLDDFPTFSLDTSTPAYNVTAINDTSVPFNYEVTTPRGVILTNNVVYASNAWTPHFVPGLGGFMSGGRLHMSAQIGGAGLPEAGHWPDYTGNGSLPGGRAWSLFRNGLDYAVQMPRTGVYMFGGDVGLAFNRGIDMDDSRSPDHISVSYLNGALPNYFGYKTWGTEKVNTAADSVPPGAYPGRSRRVWTGIEGHSGDGRPFVGRIPESVSSRKAQNQTLGGEWVAAAYDGEGMCFAWLSGRALSQMVRSGQESHVPGWFPKSFLITEERMKEKPAEPRRLGRRGLFKRLR
ncbi:hypothetical protein FDECE_10157 [Fusarium decemcellulare]|nr:hypothetical protein FDECE_10157 [Fusarium decemcellulare]